MGEMTNETQATAAAPASRLTFKAAGLTNKEATGGYTAYVAEAEGVKYRVVGNLIAGRMDGARAFRAYRVVGANGNSLVPAADGSKCKTRAAAYAQAEADLDEVLRDRAAEAEAKPEPAAAPACPAGPSCSGAAFPGHPAHYAAEIKWPTPACPDAEAGKPHAAHRIEGTWRDECKGVERVVGMPDWYAPAVAQAAERLARRHVSRSCCPSTEGDVHDRTCETGEARKQWAPRSERAEAPASDTIEYALDKLRGAFDLVCQSRNLWRDRAMAEPALVADPATDDSVPELAERIVRRAQFEALRTMLSVLDGWIDGAAENHEAMSHRDNDCCRDFAPADIRRMVNDAATELRVPEPYVPEPAPPVDAGPQFEPGDRVYPRATGGEVVTVERVAVIEGSAGRQQFWAAGEHIARHSDEYLLVKPRGEA